MSDFGITGKVSMSTEDAEAAFDRVGDKAQRMASDVATSAGKAGQAVDKIGDGAGASAEKFTRAESKISASIKRATNELELLGKTASQRLEFNISDKGLDATKFEPALKKLREIEAQAQAAQRAATGSLDKMGVSAGQTAAALRQLPAQFSDIIVSLQSGQAPLTVLLQQGAQIKDSFGGAGNAAKALGGYILGLANPFTIAAAAAAALAVAYNQGSKEADSYAKSIALTGNAAGTTGVQLQQMAARISASVGTQGAAAEALAQLVGTGKVAAQNLEQFAQTAVRVERTLGVSIQDTVKEFAELGKAPVEASKKLNESYGYLTAAVFEQIKALDSQGRALDAAALAQQSYDRAMTAATVTLEGRLGYIERAWRGVGDAAKTAWDKMLNIGRPDTLATQLENARSNLEQKLNTPLAVDNPAMRASREKGIESLRNEISLLSEQERVLKRGAEAQAVRTQAEKDGIAAAEALQKTQDKGLTKQQQMNKALAEYRKQLADLRATNPNSERLAPGAVARGESAIRDQFADKGALAAINKQENAYASLAASINEKIKANEQELKTAVPLNEADKIRIKLNEQLAAGAKDLTATRVADLNSRLQVLEVQEREKRAIADSLKVAQARQAFRESESSSIAAWMAAQDAAASAALASVRDRVKGLEDEGQALALSVSANISLAEAVERVAQARLLEKQQQFVEGSEGYLNIQREIDARKELLGLISSNEANKTFISNWKESVSQYEDVFRRGFADMLNNGKDGWKSFTKSLATTFKTTVADQIYKMFAQPFVVKLVGSFMGMFGGGGGVAGAIGGAGGGASGLMGLASNASTLYSAGSGALSLFGSGAGAAGWTGAGVGSIFGQAAGNATLGTMVTGDMASSIAAANAASAAGGGSGVLGMGGVGSGGMGAMAAGGIFAAVALAIGNALGVFRTDTLNGKGLSGTLGNGKDLQPWEEWREGGTLFDGPSFSTMNPVAELARAREQLASLQAANTAGTLGNPQQLATQQGIVDELEKQYGGLAEATAKQSKVIQAAFDAMRDSAGDMADTLGLSSDKVRSFTTLLGGEKGLNFDGLKPEEQQAKLAEALATANNELAQQILGTWETTTSQVSRIVSENIGSAGEDMQIVYSDLTETITNTRYIASEYAKDGEKAIDTLTRLATSLTTVNTIWDQLGNDMMEASLAGADAASRIAEAFGGLEAMSATTGSYFQNFYDSGEQREAARRQLEEQFGKLNLRLPDIDASNAREQYRQLAEAQDRNTEEGLKAYVALLQLSGAFASLTDSASLATETMEQQRQSAYSALERSISDSNRALQSQLDTARDVESTLGDLFDLLHDNVRELYGEVDSTRGMQATQGNAFITQALAAAQKSGYLPDADKLADAISAARGGIDGGAYTTQFGQDRDRLVLAGRLSGLEKITEKQLTDAQKTVRALEEQIEQGEQTLDFWRQQIEIASGTYEGILSVEAAIQNLQSILNPTTGKPGGANTLGGGSTPSSGTGSIPRAGYGAEEALGSFEKFKAWYTGLKSNADPSKLMGTGYEVPDWMKVSNGGADSYDDKDLFGSYLFFKNNPQYAQDYQQIIDTGRSSYATDGSTLLRTDLTKLPADVAAYYKDNPDALKAAEGFGLDPTLALQIYQQGGGQFGINQYGTNFTEWLKDNMWTPGGVKPNNNVLSLAQTGYGNYNLARWDTSTGTIIDRDGTIYSTDGKRLGVANQAQLDAVYGPGYKPVASKPGTSADDGQREYLDGIRANVQDLIDKGWTAQQLADAMMDTGTSMQTVAEAYGISVDEVRQNLIAGGATNIPKFAVGTNYVPRDMLAYIHEGEAVVPKAYNPAAGGESSGSSVRLEILVEQLLAKVANLESAANTTASNTNLMPQMGRQFDQVTQGGTVLRNKAVA